MHPKAPHAQCGICPLAQRPMCRSALPDGGASIFVIGEAPGTQEIIYDTPFVGETGKILDHMLAHIDIDTRSIAKSNAVLCRPFGNDDPPEAAIRACAPRLDAEIVASGATNVIALGNIAAQALDLLARRTIDGGILARAGRSYTNPVRGYRYTATVNPAFLMRSDSYAPNFVRHLRAGVSPRKNVFDAERVKYAIMTPENADRLLEYLYSFPIGSPLAYDVETDHLLWVDTLSGDAAALLCVVLTLEEWKSVIIPAEMLLPGRYGVDFAATHRDALKDILNRYDVIGHNVKFDQNVTAMRLGIQFDAKDDTMLMHHALQELGAHGLKELGSDYLGAPDYEGVLVDDWFKAHKISKANRRYSLLPKANLYKYAAIDGALTLQLWALFKAELLASTIYTKPYVHTVMPLANALAVVERTGIPIDRQQLSEARIEFGNELQELEDAMTAIIAPLVVDCEYSNPIVYAELKRLMSVRFRVPSATPLYTAKGVLRKNQYIHETRVLYNPKSPPQTHHIIYNLLGLTLNKTLVKPTSTNTGKEALEALPNHPFIALLRRHRRIAKMLDTYIDSIDRRADVNDVLHVDFRITGTEIGRLSASNGDHGIPRPDDYHGAMIRSVFIAAPNEVLVMADYSQAELRAFAWLSQCQFLLTKYRNGEDVHTETAIMLEKLNAPAFRHFSEYLALGKAGDVNAANAAKAIRTLAKNINFGGLVYRGGPNGIAGMMGGRVAPSAIADVLKHYKVLMPEGDIYAEKQFQLLKRRGYVETVFGRRRRFYVISDFNEDDARKAAVHMVVAGSAADLTNTSVVRLVNRGVRVCHTVHDNIIARSTPNDAKDTAAIMSEIMQTTGEEFMPGLPWIADVEIADRWCAKPERKK